ncbi:hypothetical protein ARMSODRAFT_965576 [Armillaria solidipes]|uniref:Uncharacterized protein n=1 Tax=Armillaria solidipes TaxID=1076256 RepID=A0A2H3ATM2_9AGAR|nr:hypothetical protein ARMSODRAFT_965576 [Armillaria solidipes]
MLFSAKALLPIVLALSMTFVHAAAMPVGYDGAPVAAGSETPAYAKPSPSPMWCIGAGCHGGGSGGNHNN